MRKATSAYFLPQEQISVAHLNEVTDQAGGFSSGSHSDFRSGFQDSFQVSERDFQSLLFLFVSAAPVLGRNQSFSRRSTSAASIRDLYSNLFRAFIRSIST